MIIHIDNNTDIDTDRDLNSAERHILQKLFGWKTMVHSLAEFRRKKNRLYMLAGIIPAPFVKVAPWPWSLSSWNEIFLFDLKMKNEYRQEVPLVAVRCIIGG